MAPSLPRVLLAAGFLVPEASAFVPGGVVSVPHVAMPTGQGTKEAHTPMKLGFQPAMPPPDGLILTANQIVQQQPASAPSQSASKASQFVGEWEKSAAAAAAASAKGGDEKARQVTAGAQSVLKTMSSHIPEGTDYVFALVDKKQPSNVQAVATVGISGAWGGFPQASEEDLNKPADKYGKFRIFESPKTQDVQIRELAVMPDKSRQPSVGPELLDYILSWTAEKGNLAQFIIPEEPEVKAYYKDLGFRLVSFAGQTYVSTGADMDEAPAGQYELVTLYSRAGDAIARAQAQSR